MLRRGGARQPAAFILRPLDLDDLGAKRPEPARGPGPGPHPAEVHHANVFEGSRSRHGVVLLLGLTKTVKKGSWIGRAFRRLVLRLEGVIATRRYDISGNIIPLDASRHLYNPLSHAGRGFEDPIFINFPAQCGIEPRDIYNPKFAPGYC